MVLNRTMIARMAAAVAVWMGCAGVLAGIVAWRVQKGFDDNRKAELDTWCAGRARSLQQQFMLTADHVQCGGGGGGGTAHKDPLWQWQGLLWGACTPSGCALCTCLLQLLHASPMPPSPHATITPCHHHPMPPSPHATITPCLHHPMPPSPHATITPCHHHPMPPSRHHHPMPPSPHATISPCHHHPMPPSPHATITPCHHRPMPPSPHATINPCHHHPMPPSPHATITPCHPVPTHSSPLHLIPLRSAHPNPRTRACMMHQALEGLAVVFGGVQEDPWVVNSSLTQRSFANYILRTQPARPWVHSVAYICLVNGPDRATFERRVGCVLVDTSYQPCPPADWYMDVRLWFDAFHPFNRTESATYCLDSRQHPTYGAQLNRVKETPEKMLAEPTVLTNGHPGMGERAGLLTGLISSTLTHLYPLCPLSPFYSSWPPSRSFFVGFLCFSLPSSPLSQFPFIAFGFMPLRVAHCLSEPSPLGMMLPIFKGNVTAASSLQERQAALMGVFAAMVDFTRLADFINLEVLLQGALQLPFTGDSKGMEYSLEMYDVTATDVLPGSSTPLGPRLLYGAGDLPQGNPMHVNKLIPPSNETMLQPHRHKAVHHINLTDSSRTYQLWCRPPTHSPPTHTPPTHTPPTHSPPTHSPTTHTPPTPTHTPPTHCPPTHNPPTHNPPTHNPPTHNNPPTHTPRTHNPPTHNNPPTHTPPTHNPPTHNNPPTHTPPTHNPPTHNNPPTHTPPTHNPPTHQFITELPALAPASRFFRCIALPP
ncbi:unnamed protein product [Closterium sp. NIES-65]|nr:unnamed protein product [Closterium sp. NIES-65]